MASRSNITDIDHRLYSYFSRAHPFMSDSSLSSLFYCMYSLLDNHRDLLHGQAAIFIVNTCLSRIAGNREDDNRPWVLRILEIVLRSCPRIRDSVFDSPGKWQLLRTGIEFKGVVREVLLDSIMKAGLFENLLKESETLTSFIKQCIEWTTSRYLSRLTTVHMDSFMRHLLWTYREVILSDEIIHSQELTHFLGYCRESFNNQESRMTIKGLSVLIELYFLGFNIISNWPQTIRTIENVVEGWFEDLTPLRLYRIVSGIISVSDMHLPDLSSRLVRIVEESLFLLSEVEDVQVLQSRWHRVMLMKTRKHNI